MSRVLSGLVIVLGVLLGFASASTLSFQQSQKGSLFQYVFTHAAGEEVDPTGEVDLKNFNKLKLGTSLSLAQEKKFSLLIASSFQTLKKNYFASGSYLDSKKYQTEVQDAKTYLLYPFVVTRKADDAVDTAVVGLTEYGLEGSANLPERTGITIDASHENGETTLIVSQISTGNKCHNCEFSVSFGPKPAQQRRVLTTGDGEDPDEEKPNGTLNQAQTTLNLDDEREEGLPVDENPEDLQQSQGSKDVSSQVNPNPSADLLESKPDLEAAEPQHREATKLSTEDEEVSISPDGQEGHEKVEVRFSKFKRILVKCTISKKVDLAQFPFSVGAAAKAFYYCEQSSRVAVRLYKEGEDLHVEIGNAGDGPNRLLI